MAIVRTHIPRSAVKRLTSYLTQVQRMMEKETEWVSSQELAVKLGLTSSTVRQDLSHVDFSGTSKKGYRTQLLEQALIRTLGADRTWNAVVVGAGNLGRALARHSEFMRHGFRICGVFDSDPAKIGKKVGSLSIRDWRELPKAIREGQIELGIIAVPSQAAQSVADLMIASGVRGILNLALAHVITPERVPVVDSRIVSSLLELSHAVKSRS
jgi:redox-sensing transcriptional repressor